MICAGGRSLPPKARGGTGRQSLFLPSRAAQSRRPAAKAIPARHCLRVYIDYNKPTSFFMNFLSQEICGGPLQKGCRIFLFPGGKCKNSSYNFVKSIQKICICAIITPNRPQPRPCAFRALMLLYTDAIENQLNTLCSAPQKRCRSAEKGGTGYDGRKDRAHQCAGQRAVRPKGLPLKKKRSRPRCVESTSTP